MRLSAKGSVKSWPLPQYCCFMQCPYFDKDNSAELYNFSSVLIFFDLYLQTYLKKSSLSLFSLEPLVPPATVPPSLSQKRLRQLKQTLCLAFDFSQSAMWPGDRWGWAMQREQGRAEPRRGRRTGICVSWARWPLCMLRISPKASNYTAPTDCLVSLVVCCGDIWWFCASCVKG